jgi:hypothetical protein
VADGRYLGAEAVRRAWIASRSRTRVALASGLVLAVGVTTAAVLSNSHDDTTVALGASAATEEAAALEQARRTGKQVLVPSLTDETTEVFARPEGDFQANLAAAPVRVNKGGTWVPVDLNLRAQTDGTVVPAAHVNDLRLTGQRPDGTHELAAVGQGANRVAMHWTGMLPAPTLDGTTATYRDVYPHVDLTVKASRIGFEQSLVVNDRTALSRLRSIVLPLTGPGARSYRTDTAGTISLLDGAGRVTSTIPQPAMWDSTKTPAGAPARSTAIRTTVSRTADGLALTLTPDQAWLRSPRTVFPVTLDPTVNPLATTFDTYVRASVTTDQSGAKDMQIGLLATTPATITRSFITWNSSVLSGKQITAATVKFWNYWSGDCTAKSWAIWPTAEATASTRYTTQPQWLGTAPSATSTATKGGTNCADDWATIDGKNFFQHFATAKSSKAFMGIRATDETDTAAFKQFRTRDGDAAAEVPQASVTYNAYPVLTARATVPATACATGAGRPLVNTLTPQLQATVSDADHSPTVQFEWWSVDTNAKIGGANVTAVATGATATVTVPAGAFTDGGRYKWRVLVTDGVAGSSTWSSFCEMTTWVTIPPAAGCDGGTDRDYNGDGIQDVAIADPEASVDGIARAGSVTVVYGGSATTQLLHQNLPGIPDSSEAGDQFGFALATYDANRDGCSDLVATAPFEAIGTAAEAGYAVLMLGSPNGLNQGPAAIAYDQGTTGWGDDVEAGDWFGYSVAAGATSTGEPYLAIGAPGEDVNTAVDAGLVHYHRGTTNITMWSGSGVTGAAENDDRVGYALAGSPNHLAVGSPGEAIVSATWAGMVSLFTHEVTGTVLKNIGVVGADSLGDQINQGDTLGKSLAMAPSTVSGAPGSLLLIGAPGKDVGAKIDAGKVFRVAVTATSWTAIGAVTEASPNDGDYFGEQVQLGGPTLTGVAGIPGKDVNGLTDAGALAVFPATPTSATPVTLTRDSAGLPGTPAKQELIGAYLGTSPAQLYVGSPARQTVQAVSWSSLANGSPTAGATWTTGVNGLPAGVTFGAATN